MKSRNGYLVSQVIQSHSFAPIHILIGAIVSAVLIWPTAAPGRSGPSKLPPISASIPCDFSADTKTLAAFESCHIRMSTEIPVTAKPMGVTDQNLCVQPDMARTRMIWFWKRMISAVSPHVNRSMACGANPISDFRRASYCSGVSVRGASLSCNLRFSLRSSSVARLASAMPSSCFMISFSRRDISRLSRDIRRRLVRIKMIPNMPSPATPMITTVSQISLAKRGSVAIALAVGEWTVLPDRRGTDTIKLEAVNNPPMSPNTVSNTQNAANISSLRMASSSRFLSELDNSPTEIVVYVKRDNTFLIVVLSIQAITMLV